MPSEGVLGACFLLPCFQHVDIMQQKHQRCPLDANALTPFVLVSTVAAYRHCILLSAEHLLEHVFSCGHLSLSYFTGSEVGTSRACLSHLRMLGVALLKRDSSKAVNSCGIGTSRPQRLQLPFFCQHKQAKLLVKRISPHCRTSKSSC